MGPKISIQEVLELIRTAYGSLEEPNFGKAKKNRMSSIYIPLLVEVGKHFGGVDPQQERWLIRILQLFLMLLLKQKYPHCALHFLRLGVLHTSNWLQNPSIPTKPPYSALY